jgi:hypothetical protein
MRRNTQSRVSDETSKVNLSVIVGGVSKQDQGPSTASSGAAHRAALIQAARRFIASGKLNVPVLEITQAADVGMGSFYNHFDNKEELFEAAVAMCSTPTAPYSISSRQRSTIPRKRSPAASA